MLSKAYIVLLALSLSAMAFFTYYAWSWLQSIGQPAAAVEGFSFHAQMSWTFLWVTATLLLALGNAVLWVTGRAWAMWVSFAYFSVFVAVRAFWLDQTLASFLAGNPAAADAIRIGPFFAAVLILLFAAITFFDQFIIIRLRAKTYPPTQPEVESEDIDLK